MKSGVKIDESETKRFYDEKKWELFKVPEEVRSAFILAKAGPADPPEKRELARKRIEEAHKRLTDGEPFPRIARQYSEDVFVYITFGSPPSAR